MSVYHADVLDDILAFAALEPSSTEWQDRSKARCSPSILLSRMNLFNFSLVSISKKMLPLEKNFGLDGALCN